MEIFKLILFAIFIVAFFVFALSFKTIFNKNAKPVGGSCSSKSPDGIKTCGNCTGSHTCETK